MPIFIPLSSFINTPKGTIRSEFVSNKSIIFGKNRAIQKVVSSKLEDDVDLYEIEFFNNEKIYIGTGVKVESMYGKVLSEKLSVGDYIKNDFSINVGSAPEKDIGWENNLKKSKLMLRIPQRMNQMFAYWLGIVLSRGVHFRGKSIIAIQVKNDYDEKEKAIVNEFIKASKIVFDITPIGIKKKNKKFLGIKSKNLSDFLTSIMGSSYKFKKVPKNILEASSDEQLFFLKGVSIKGKMDTSRVVFFSSRSKLLVEQISFLLKNFGYGVYIGKSLSGSKREVYFITLKFKKEASISLHTSNPKLDLNKICKKFDQIINPELLNTVRVKKNNSSYKTLLKIKKENKIRVVGNFILNNIGISDESYYVQKIKSIRKVTKNCNVIEVDNPLLGVQIGSVIHF